MGSGENPAFPVDTDMTDTRDDEGMSRREYHASNILQGIAANSNENVMYADDKKLELAAEKAVTAADYLVTKLEE